MGLIDYHFGTNLHLLRNRRQTPSLVSLEPTPNLYQTYISFFRKIANVYLFYILLNVPCTFCFTLPMAEFPSYENSTPLLLGICHKATPDDWFMTKSENDNYHLPTGITWQEPPLFEDLFDALISIISISAPRRHEFLLLIILHKLVIIIMWWKSEKRTPILFYYLYYIDYSCSRIGM